VEEGGGRAKHVRIRGMLPLQRGGYRTGTVIPVPYRRGTLPGSSRVKSNIRPKWLLTNSKIIKGRKDRLRHYLLNWGFPIIPFCHSSISVTPNYHLHPKFTYFPLSHKYFISSPQSSSRPRNVSITTLVTHPYHHPPTSSMPPTD
jgi:hypothetical protein